MGVPSESCELGARSGMILTKFKLAKSQPGFAFEAVVAEAVRCRQRILKLAPRRGEIRMGLGQFCARGDFTHLDACILNRHRQSYVRIAADGCSKQDALAPKVI